MKKVTIRVPDEMHAALVQHADDQGRSLSNLFLQYTRVEANRRNTKIRPIRVLREEEAERRRKIDVMDEVYGRR